MTNNNQSWLGVEGSDLSFELTFDPLKLTVTDGGLSLNQAPDGENKLDWNLAAAQTGVPFSLAVDEGTSLHVEGSAAIEFDGLFAVEGSFALDQYDIMSPQGTYAGFAGGTALALQLQVSGSVPSGTVSGSGTLKLLQLTDTAGQSWLGVEASCNNNDDQK